MVRFERCCCSSYYCLRFVNEEKLARTRPTEADGLGWLNLSEKDFQNADDYASVNADGQTNSSSRKQIIKHCYCNQWLDRQDDSCLEGMFSIVGHSSFDSGTKVYLTRYLIRPSC